MKNANVLVPCFGIALLFSACSSDLEYDLKSGKQDTEVRGENPMTPSFKESLGELLLPLFEEEDTLYAPNYDEIVFKSLQFQEAQSQVVALLGEPLARKKFPDGYVCWYYTEPGKKFPSYFIRVLVFDASGLLVARHKSFYLDW